jgi:hypothetical protein
MKYREDCLAWQPCRKCRKAIRDHGIVRTLSSDDVEIADPGSVTVLAAVM